MLGSVVAGTDVPNRRIHRWTFYDFYSQLDQREAIISRKVARYGVFVNGRHRRCFSFFDRDSREGGKGRGTSVASPSQRYYRVPATYTLACLHVTVYTRCTEYRPLYIFFSRQPSFLSRIVAKIQNLAAWAMGNVSNL